MSRNRPSWETLNAFVDGELPESEVQRIRQAIRRNPDIADDIAALRQMKAVVKGAYLSSPTDEIELPGKYREPRRYWRWGAAAACVLGMVLSVPYLNTPKPSGFVADAYQIHRSWLQMPSVDQPYGQQKAVSTHLNPAGVFIPDLSELSLQLERFEPVVIDQRAGIHVGYRGVNGCAVSLLSWPSSGAVATSGLTTIKDEATEFYSWQVSGWAYLMLASQMPAPRRETTAQVLYDITLDRQPPGHEHQQLMMASRAQSQPCQTS